MKKTLIISIIASLFLGEAVHARSDSNLDRMISQEVSNVFSESYNDGYDDMIEHGIREALEEELARRAEDEIWYKEGRDRSKRHDHYINRRVRRTIKRDVSADKRRKRRAWIYSSKKNKPAKKPPVYIYKVPRWPFFSQFFEQKDLFQIDVSVSGASQAYSSAGRTQDMSKLAFGQGLITIKDICLASKLAKLGKIEFETDMTMRHPDVDDLKTLADQPVVFDGSTFAVLGAANFARHFRKGDVTVGFQIPVGVRENKLRLTSKLTDNVKNNLRSDGSFTGKTLEEILVDKILKAKNIDFNRTYRTTSLGDIGIFAHCDIGSKAFERLVFGINVMLPTAREQDSCKLWEPELGGGGFSRVELFTSMLWDVHRFFNPHAHVSLNIGVPGKVTRRVPERITYTTNEPREEIEKKLVCGENIRLLDPACPLDPLMPPTAEEASFSELDSTVRHFANTPKKVKIRPGIQVTARVGTVIEKAILSRGFFDVFYQARVRGKDYLGFRRHDDVFEPDIWLDNSYQVEHKVGFDYSYQFNENYRAFLGGTYAFAGKNVPKDLEGHITFNFEF